MDCLTGVCLSLTAPGYACRPALTSATVAGKPRRYANPWLQCRTLRLVSGYKVQPAISPGL